MDKGGLYIGAGHVVGVAVQAAADGAVVFTYAYVQRKGDQMLLRSTGSAPDLEALITAIGTRVPLVLCMDTPRCVHRVLPQPGSSEDLVAQAFPNAPLADLCVSLWRHGSGTGLSMVRANEAQQLLTTITSMGARVVALHIGPWDLLGLLPLLGKEAGDLSLQHHLFRISNGALVALERTDPPSARTLTLGEDQLPETCALAFAAAWNHVVANPAQEAAEDPLITDGRRQEKARRWYEGWMVGALVTLLLLLAGEQWLSHSLNGRRRLLEGAGADRAELARQVAADQALLEERSALARELGLDTTRRLAAWAAEIGATVPAGIRLERLAADPLQGTLKEREPVVFTRGTTRVRGTCSSTSVLNTWMDTLRQLRPGASVHLLGYTTGPDHGEPVFEIELDP